MNGADLKLKIDFSLAKLRESMVLYGKLSDKSDEEVIAKQGGKLAWNIYRGLRELMPTKGLVMAERLAALKFGRGVKVRPAVLKEIAEKYQATYSLTYGKTFLAQRRGRRVVSMGTTVESRSGKALNLQALAVQRELTLRETGRGFLSISTPRPTRSFEAEANVAAASGVDLRREIESKYGFLLSDYGLKFTDVEKVATLRWLGRRNDMYQDAVVGLSKPRQMAVVVKAVEQTNADIKVYIERKLAENAKSSGL